MITIKRIKLSEQPKYIKYRLASAVGLTVQEINPKGRCIIVGADKYIENEFRSIDEVLLGFKDMLARKGFKVV